MLILSVAVMVSSCRDKQTQERKTEKTAPAETDPHGQDSFHGGPKGSIPAGSGGSLGARGLKEDITVEKAPGNNAYAIAEVFEKRTDLNGSRVVVRGKVVKISKNIMGRNWIHLQDGSGELDKENYDLVVTSQAAPSVGDVITITGTVHADKDFGAGYRYDVIIEEAEVTE